MASEPDQPSPREQIAACGVTVANARVAVERARRIIGRVRERRRKTDALIEKATAVLDGITRRRNSEPR